MFNIVKTTTKPALDDVVGDTLYLIRRGMGLGVIIYVSNKDGTVLERVTHTDEDLVHYSDNTSALIAGLLPGTPYHSDGDVRVVLKDVTYEITASSTYRTDTIDRTLDNNPDTSWGSGGTLPVTIDIVYNVIGEAWMGYTFRRDPQIPGVNGGSTCRYEGASSPKRWVLEASNDNDAWTILDEQDDQEIVLEGGDLSYSIINRTIYKYYRFVFYEATVGSLINLTEFDPIVYV